MMELDHVGRASGLHWFFTGTALESRIHTGTARDCYCNGTAIVMLRYDTLVLHRFWTGFALILHGTDLVLRWYCVGTAIVLDWYWYYSGTAVRIDLVSHWYSTHTRLVQVCCRAVAAMILDWHWAVTALVQDWYWADTGGILDWYWIGTGLLPDS